jgi:hypothetical protein
MALAAEPGRLIDAVEKSDHARTADLLGAGAASGEIPACCRSESSFSGRSVGASALDKAQASLQGFGRRARSQA